MEINKEEPLVSIIIPCYNHEEYVQECIQSVIDQNYNNIELIIIDDGSKDGSVAKIKELVSDCEKRFIRFEFRTRSNKGLCATLNEAIAWSEGDFYSTIASDDIMVSSKIASQVAEYMCYEGGESISAVFSGYSTIDANKKVIDCFQYDRKRYVTLKNYYGRRWLCASTALIKIEHLKQLKGYDENLPFEDLDMWIRLLKEGTTFIVLKQSLVFLRKHESNMSSNYRKMFMGEMKVYWKHKDNLMYPLAVIASVKSLIKSYIKS